MKLLDLTRNEIEDVLSKDKKYLIRLKPDFINNRIHMRTIREDHFLSIEKDNNLYRLQMIPNISIYIDSDELYNSFDRQMFVIDFIRGITQDDISF